MAWRDSTASTREPTNGDHEPIAIIGVSGRYPGGADSIDLLWQRLLDGTDCIGDIAGQRWDLGYHDETTSRADRIYTRAAGLLRQIDTFDAEFFNISPREARRVDPQQRLLLELSWEALEDAGLLPKNLAGSATGVYVGISAHDYCDLQNDVHDGQSDAYANAGNTSSIAANRISYFFDFRGPSMAIDTACSSALVAVHQACRSLATGDTSLALACGVNILVQPKLSLGFCRASMLSPTGRCMAFDAAGDGYVRSEGGGVVVLKRLTDAERSGDPIRAVILASRVNSDGRTQGLSLPNEFSQEELLRQIYRDAGVGADRVFYVEAHGTGTPAGDPIEARAIGRVLGLPRSDGTKCLIGSVKSNIGHLEAASGIAGLTKILLALQHRKIPANLHFRVPNPKIAFEDLRLRVVDKHVPLPDGHDPVVMGASSYGFGGTNAHVIVQEYRPSGTTPDEQATRHRSLEEANLLLISARSKSALQALAASYATLLPKISRTVLPDLCSTAALQRTHHQDRLVAAASDPAELARRLERFSRGEQTARLATAHVTAERPKLAFVYSGNGSQWSGMGRTLIENDGAFRRDVEIVDDLFLAHSGWSIMTELRQTEDAARMELTEVAQPTLFALQVGMTNLLRRAGVSPAAVVGHSVGEVAAAWASGALSLEQAVHTIYVRSRAQGRTAGAGAMAAVGLSAEAAAAVLAEIGGWIEIAGINSPRSITVAGDPAALDSLEQLLRPDGAFFRKLPLNYAFHSAAMDAVEAEVRDELQWTTATATIPFISTVEGSPIPGTQLNGAYWWRNIREPVRFSDAVTFLIKDGSVNIFVEVGPHPILRDYIQQCAVDGRVAATVVPTLRRPRESSLDTELDQIWTAICACHASGASELTTLFQRPRHPVPLPPYPWQRQRHWVGAAPMPGIRIPVTRDHPLLGHRVESGDAIWENTLSLMVTPWLQDHVIGNSTLFPFAAFIEMILAAGSRLFGNQPLDIEDLDLRKALVVPDDSSPIIQLTIGEDGDVRLRSLRTPGAEDWISHCGGGVSVAPVGDRARNIVIDAIASRLGTVIPGPEHYRQVAARGFAFGPRFQGVAEIRVGRNEALAKVSIPHGIADEVDVYRLHPCLLDACLQALSPLIAAEDQNSGFVFLPAQIQRFRLYRGGARPMWSHATVRSRSRRSILADIAIVDEAGGKIAELTGFRCLGVELFRASTPPLFFETWQPVETAGSLVLPAPAEIAAALSSAIDRFSTSQEHQASCNGARPLLDRALAASSAGALDKLSGDRGAFSIERLVCEGAILQEWQSFAEHLAEGAVAHGFLERLTDGSLKSAACSVKIGQDLWREALTQYPQSLAESLLLVVTGSRLADFLGGACDPIQTLLPDKGSSALDHYYDSAVSLDVCYRIVCACVEELLRRVPPDANLRVLELGGGTGALTARLLPLLPPDRADYLFTEANKTLLQRAEQRFSFYRFARFKPLEPDRILDDRNPSSPERFDLIIAGDALHLGSDLHPMLDRLRHFLLPAGELLLYPPHGDALSDFVLHLIAQRSDVEPKNRRSISPRLSPDAWRRLLDKLGFDRMAVLSRYAPPQHQADELQRTVILAQRPVKAERNDRSESRSITAQTVLLMVDASPAGSRFGRAVAAALAAAGQRTVFAELGNTFVKTAPDRFSVRATELDDFAQLLDALDRQGTEIDEIVHLAGITPRCRPTTDELIVQQQQRCLTTILLVQALKQCKPRWDPRLSLVTAGAHGGPTTDISRLDPGQAPLWGLGRVLSNEHGDLAIRLIDLHLALDECAAAQRLVAALGSRDGETEVLLTEHSRFVNRIRATSTAEQAVLSQKQPSTRYREPMEEIRYKVDFTSHGALDNLFFSSTAASVPDSGMVEVRVHAAGLNFRDVMWVMGLLPEEALADGYAGATLGLEYAGEITRLGPDVADVAIGDRIFGFGSSCFASHVLVPAATVMKIPSGLSFASAATIPSVFFTAYYALEHLAKLRPGEGVLIHGAAGGVGLAAVQIAQRRGAVVFGTAGAPEKREVLRLLGVDHVFDSRSLEFADRIMEITGGSGVDVVLNSIAGEAIAKSLKILKPQGRFIEIGKRDFYANTKLGLRPFRRNISYFAVDADTMMIERPDLTRQIFVELANLFERKELRPLPYRAFPVSRISEAFRYMQQSRQIGKVVVTMGEESPKVLSVVGTGIPVFRDATYLITGGLSGFGLATARWLASKGARHLALVGRRGIATEEARKGVAALEEMGVAVRVCPVDVSKETAVVEMIAEISAAMPTIRGVVHAAMVLDDGIVLRLNWDRLHKVMAPKVTGAWNLHHATLSLDLDFFILYSSATTLIGSPGQANYVAANMYLESLAAFRRALGKPALAVGWGAIGEVGYIARNPSVAEAARGRLGVENLKPAGALAALERLFAAGATSVTAAFINWPAYIQGLPSLSSPRAIEILGAASDQPDNSEDFLSALDRAPAAERESLVIQRLNAHFGKVLGTTDSSIDGERRLSELGLDSLMAVEVAQHIERDMKLDVPIMELIQSGSLRKIAESILNGYRKQKPQSDVPVHSRETLETT